MAKNWKVGEAVRAIKSGNKEDILDIGRRFPLFANLAAQVNEAGVTLLDCVPEYCSARKIESVLKDGVQESEDEGTEEEAKEEAKPVKKAADKDKKAPAKKAAKKAEKEEDDEDSLESKSAKELFEMCKEAGLKVKPKQDKSVYIEALKASDEDAEDEEDDWDESEDEEEAPKKAEKKTPAKADKKKPAKKDEEEDDDWDV